MQSLGKHRMLGWGLGLGLLIAQTGFAAPEVRIVSPKLSGSCAESGAEVKVQKQGNYYYLKVFFNGSMYMQTDPGVKNADNKRCTIEFGLALDPGLRFESFTFTVDGVYQLADKGTARLTIANVIGMANAVRNTIFFSLAGGSNVQGDLLDGGVAGSIEANQVNPIYQGCGAQIPLETSIYGTVNQPSLDQSGMTYINLDSGHSNAGAVPDGVCNGAYCIGKLKVGGC